MLKMSFNWVYKIYLSNYFNLFFSSWDLNLKIYRKYNVYFIKVNIEATKNI